MSLAVFENVSLHFGKKTIVDGLNLRIGHDDRIGVVGPNGSGKSSLMRMLAGQQVPDGGRIVLRRGLRLGFLPQDIELAGGRCLIAFVRDSVPGRTEMDDAVARCEAELATLEAQAHTDAGQAKMMALAEELSDLHERVTHYDMHFTEHEATRILAGLGFEAADLQRDLAEFSGGWRMRAVLAALLYQKPDLLLLDEPTNHLDMPSVAWFANFLAQYKRAFLLICHDREFLNEQIRRVVSFETEGVRQYSGDYDHYLKQRAEEEIILENKAKNIAREREQAERFINRFRAQASKARAVQSKVKSLAKMEQVETYQKRRGMRFNFPPSERCASEPLTLRNLGKRYDDHQVLADVNLTVRRGEKIGIIGVNGAGKTTLLRMIAQEITLSSGSIELGHNVKVGYYAQHHADTLHKDSTVFEEVAREDSTASVTRVRTILGAFLFSNDDADKKVGVLSGGERARVALAKLLINPGNLLLMDEPTNHLDLDSSEALAESLATYDGTLIFVSHNRSFVRRLATRIWDVADGTVRPYPGTLDEYLDTHRTHEDDTTSTDTPQAVAPEQKSRKRGSRAEEKERRRRQAEARKKEGGRGKLEKEARSLEARIAELERTQQERSSLLADPQVYTDTERSCELTRQFEQTRSEIETLTERWIETQAHLGNG